MVLFAIIQVIELDDDKEENTMKSAVAYRKLHTFELGSID
jgi:hypothetical protein